MLCHFAKVHVLICLMSESHVPPALLGPFSSPPAHLNFCRWSLNSCQTKSDQTISNTSKADDTISLPCSQSILVQQRSQLEFGLYMHNIYPSIYFPLLILNRQKKMVEAFLGYLRKKHFQQSSAGGSGFSLSCIYTEKPPEGGAQ